MEVFKMASTIQIRVEDDLKNKELCIIHIYL